MLVSEAERLPYRSPGIVNYMTGTITRDDCEVPIVSDMFIPKVKLVFSGSTKRPMDANNQASEPSGGAVNTQAGPQFDSEDDGWGHGEDSPKPAQGISPTCPTDSPYDCDKVLD